MKRLIQEQSRTSTLLLLTRENRVPPGPCVAWKWRLNSGWRKVPWGNATENAHTPRNFTRGQLWAKEIK